MGRHKGFKVSPETIERQRQASIGRTHTPETREKMRQAALGRKRSPETCAKMSASQTAIAAALSPDERHARYASYGMQGKRQPPESIAARVAANRGRKNSAAAIQRMRDAALQRWAAMSPADRAAFAAMRTEKNRGRRHSPATRAKMSASGKRYWETGDPIELEQRRAHARAAMRLAHEKEAAQHVGTSIERIVAARLDASGIPYLVQQPLGVYFVDFYLPEMRTVIDVQGCYWHGCIPCGYGHMTDRHLYDQRRKGWLQKHGYEVITIWEHELRK